MPRSAAGDMTGAGSYFTNSREEFSGETAVRSSRMTTQKDIGFETTDDFRYDNFSQGVRMGTRCQGMRSI